MPLSNALAPSEDRFPAFFLPVLRCGELSGRIDESLRYLAEHCRLLAVPARTMRDTWLVPLCIIVAGSVFCSLAYFVFAPLSTALHYAADTILGYAVAALVVCVLFGLPRAKPILHGLRLAIPVVGSAERELALNRFFHAMSLLYSTGGIRVEAMVRLAAESADNVILRGDFLRAAGAIESGASIAEGFSTVTAIPADFKTTLVSGDQAGKLEAAFDTISRLAGDAARHRWTVFQRIFFRVVAASVTISILMTLYGLVTMGR